MASTSAANEFYQLLGDLSEGDEFYHLLRDCDSDSNSKILDDVFDNDGIEWKDPTDLEFELPTQSVKGEKARD